MSWLIDLFTDEHLFDTSEMMFDEQYDIEFTNKAILHNIRAHRINKRKRSIRSILFLTLFLIVYILNF